jgi:hypothetical protein
MQAARAYLLMRSRTIGRQVGELGGLRLALLTPMLVLAVGNALFHAGRHPYGQWAVPGVVGLLVLYMHRQRGDLRFLTTVAPGFRPWLALEYGLLALPAALVLLGLGAVGAAWLTLGLTPLAAWAPPARDRSRTRQRRSLFRSEAFEWVSGLRATQGVVLWPVLLGLAAWQQPQPLGPVLALVGWLLLLLPLYGTPEPASMLALAAPNPAAFLRRRLALGLGYAGLTAAPFLWLLGSGPAGPGAVLAVGAVYLGLLSLVILTKYAFYPNALQIRFSQAVVVAVVVALPGNPIYPPLLLVIAGGLIWQSQHRLKSLIPPSEPGTNKS